MQKHALANSEGCQLLGVSALYDSPVSPDSNVPDFFVRLPVRETGRDGD